MARFFGMFQTVVDEDPLGAAKAVASWVEKRPANDPMGLVIAMTHLLEDASAKQPPITPNRVQALLTLDRLSLAPLAQLQAQYRLPSLSDEVRQQLWHARNNLARWVAYAYEQIYEAIRKQENRGPYQSLLHGLFARMFYHRGVQAKQGLFRYEQWIPAKWKFLHMAYKEALDLGIATAPFNIAPEAPAERCTPEHEYIHFLLMQRVNTGNLSVMHIDLAAVWLREWFGVLHLVPSPPEGNTHWMLDLGQAEGLVTPSADRTPAGTVLYLDVAPLREKLEALKAQVTEQLALAGASKAEVREWKDKLALVKRLEALWLPHAKLQPRRGERRPEQQPVLVAAGWSEIAVFMREARPWKPHDPYHYTYDDAAELVSRGRVANQKAEKVDAYAGLRPDRKGWRIQDASDTGCRIVSTTKIAAQLQLGALLTLMREHDERWRVAIVRRLKRRTAEHTELGVEIIAESSVLVMPEPLVARDSGYSVNGIDVSAKGKRFDALYLPPQQNASPVYSMVMPVSEYAPGKLLTLALSGENRVIRLAVAIEYNKDWVWSTFDVVPPQR